MTELRDFGTRARDFVSIFMPNMENVIMRRDARQRFHSISILMLIGWGILVCVLFNKAANQECKEWYMNSTYHTFEKLLLILPCKKREELIIGSTVVNTTIVSNATDDTINNSSLYDYYG